LTIFTDKHFILQQDSFKHHALQFRQLLQEMDLQKVTDDPYAQSYLQQLILHSAYYLQIYGCMFEQAIEKNNKKLQELVVVDVGSGNGLLGIFASYCGFGKVYLNEPDPAFLKASKYLAGILQIDIQDFISTDAMELHQYSFAHQPDLVFGADVIEHIYNLDLFFNSLKVINPSMVSVFTTASNPRNLVKTGIIRRLQQKDEWYGNDGNDRTGSPSHSSYFEIRKQLILETFDGLSDHQLNLLAKQTRGLRRDDIIEAVEQWKLSGAVPPGIDHPTNTCHPVTGSWTERLMNEDEYKKIINANGFDTTIIPGFYNTHKKGLKLFPAILLNKAMTIFGLRLAPFMFLVCHSAVQEKNS